jgi:hypothetical protein
VNHFGTCPATQRTYCLQHDCFYEVLCMECCLRRVAIEQGQQRFNTFHLGSTSWHPDWPLTSMNGEVKA